MLLCVSTASVLPSTLAEHWGEVTDYSGTDWENSGVRSDSVLTGNMDATGVMSLQTQTHCQALQRIKEWKNLLNLTHVVRGEGI